MWNNLFRLTLVSYVWKRYRRTLITLPLLLLYFWLINLIHHDTIAYAQLQGEASWLGWTFLVKWAFIILGIIVFIALHINNKASDKKSDEPTKRSFFKDEPISKGNHEQQEPPETNDAFNNIRQKKTLRSKADIILEKI